MRGSNGFKFFAVILTIGILTYLAVYGLNIGDFRIKSAYDIIPGIDIKGGVDVRLQAMDPKTNKAFAPAKSDLEDAKVIIGKRLDIKGIVDRNITTNADRGYIVVQIPNQKDVKPEDAVKLIGQTARLTFQEVDPKDYDAATGYVKDEKNLKPTNKVLVEGSDVKNAKPAQGESGMMDVALEFNSKGAKAFADATTRLIGKPIAIFLDDQCISAPRVESAITGGEASIQGNFTPEAAKELSQLIKSGSLKFSLRQDQISSISPTLGEKALDVTLMAGVVAFILVCLFMLGYYRLPGIMACIALFGHTVIQLLVLSWANLTVTLPGIAGIILTIGMGVDANVIIFERIKEELRNGKTLRTAIDIGFKRAFAAIFDANMTTLISAAVLWKFGTGPMISFAWTLGLGVALSFLTAVTASRIMLKSVADINIAKHHKLYGV